MTPEMTDPIELFKRWRRTALLDGESFLQQGEIVENERVTMPNHWRRCWDCENLAVHADNVVPHVLCGKCGSQDTRPLKLKPCPFCGQAATIQKGGEHNGKSYFSVGCADYKCRGCHGTSAAPEEQLSQEIRAWNQRAKETADVR